MMRKISKKEEMGGHIIRGLAIKNDKSKRNRAESKDRLYRESCITMNTHELSFNESDR